MMSCGWETARRTISRMASLLRSARAARQSAANWSMSNIGGLLSFDGGARMGRGAVFAGYQAGRARALSSDKCALAERVALGAHAG